MNCLNNLNAHKKLSKVLKIIEKTKWQRMKTNLKSRDIPSMRAKAFSYIAFLVIKRGKKIIWICRRKDARNNKVKHNIKIFPVIITSIFWFLNIHKFLWAHLNIGLLIGSLEISIHFLSMILYYLTSVNWN